ncbi:MAG: hypothetical protein WAW36_03745 [Methylovulum miyakonense]|uniref:hypothetical protein n=1 Tax=Methylovulum miyakonense TaxID=645578 RepID=UPI003BB5749D
MNLYFLVEGQTERKVYPKWLAHLLPDGFSRVNAAKQAIENNYFLISGGGYPSILDNHLRNSVEEVNQYGNYDWLILAIDADEMSAQDKINEVEFFIKTEKIVLTSNCALKVIVQNCCMETWFLGNRKVYKQNPHLSELGHFSDFYNVYQNDPELMTKPNSYQGSLGDYHHEYLKQMLLERNIRYSKTKPNHVVENHYVTQLKNRINETAHLPSLNDFFNFCEAISK